MHIPRRNRQTLSPSFPKIRGSKAPAQTADLHSWRHPFHFIQLLGRQTFVVASAEEPISYGLWWLVWGVNIEFGEFTGNRESDGLFTNLPTNIDTEKCPK